MGAHSRPGGSQMAKLTKSQVQDAAVKAARANRHAKYTEAQVLALGDYTARRAAADTIAKMQAEGLDDAYLKFGYALTFSSELQNTWFRTLKAADNARASFRRAAQGLTVEEAVEKVKATITSMNIRGAEVDDHSVTVNRTERRSNEGTLYFSYERDDYDGHANPDDPTQRVYTYSLKLRISTSGSSWTPSQMAVIHKVQGELLDAANELTAVMENLRVISRWGFPE